MKQPTWLLLASAILFIPSYVQGQQPLTEDPIVASRDEVIYYTAAWEGDRLPDGRPHVSDDLLQRLVKLKVEDVWQLLNELGYRNQFEGGWKMIHDDRPVVGRALTTFFLPLRPDVQERLFRDGQAAGRIGAMNSWPIDLLRNGDVYIADNDGKVAQGTLIGDKLGNSIFARSNVGVVFDGSLRDLDTLAQIPGFNAFVRDFHPSFLEETMLAGVNVPIRIGRISVMPGDVILAKRIGMVVIPPHLVEQVVITAEIVELRDEFALERVRALVYTPGQVDSRWTPEIEQDFLTWLGGEGRADRLPVPLAEMQDYLQQRTW